MEGKKARVSKFETFESRLENLMSGYFNPKKSIGGKIFTLGSQLIFKGRISLTLG